MHPLCRTVVQTLVVLGSLSLPGTVSATESDPATFKAHPKTHRPTAKPKPGEPVRGRASYYAHSLAGRKTASGERYDPDALTAAHRTLPLGTKLKVTNPKNERSVVVTVNDRGPVPKDRMVDLSNAAAKELGMTKAGTAQVETEVVGGKTAAEVSKR